MKNRLVVISIFFTLFSVKTKLVNIKVIKQHIQQVFIIDYIQFLKYMHLTTNRNKWITILF